MTRRKKADWVYYVSYLLPIQLSIRKLALIEAADDYVAAREVHPSNGKSTMLRIPRVLSGRQQVFDTFVEARCALMNYHEDMRRMAHAQLVVATQNIAAAQQLEAT